MAEKIIADLNDRPRDETIAQSGDGIPDDSGKPVEVTDEEVERIGSNLTGGDASGKLKREIAEEIDLTQRGSA
jgi:hypothetical protein